ncbi:MAG: DUF4328 domain-containing protein [Actinobacteria bacterium]|nr:DUF4328 domain-containing protein [Actinomycetota bacterium]
MTDLELAERIAPEPPALAIGTPLCPRCGQPDFEGVEFCGLCGMSMAGAHRHGIDGPQEGVWTAPGPHGLLTYRSIRARTRVFRSVLMLAIVVSLASAFAHLAYYAGLDPILPRLPVDNSVWADWIGRLRTEVVAIVVLVCVAAAWWTSRAYRNLLPMQIRGLRVSVTLARVAWLIPLANVWLSKPITDDLFRASDPAVGFRSSTWRKRPAPLLSNVGWVALICALLLIPLSVALMPDVVASNEGQLRVALLIGVSGYLLLVLGLGALAVLADQIADRQEARVDRLGTSPRPSLRQLHNKAAQARVADEQVEAEAAAAAARTGRLDQRPTSGDPLWGSY